MTGVLMQRGNSDTETGMHTERPPCEHGGSNLDVTDTSQEMPKMTIRPPEANRDAWDRQALTVHRQKPTG